MRDANIGIWNQGLGRQYFNKLTREQKKIQKMERNGKNTKEISTFIFSGQEDNFILHKSLRNEA